VSLELPERDSLQRLLHPLARVHAHVVYVHLEAAQLRRLEICTILAEHGSTFKKKLSNESVFWSDLYVPVNTSNVGY
jgi:hypothetical protein